MEWVAVLKVFKLIFTILLICIVSTAVLPWFIFPVINDIKAANLKNQLLSAKLPEKTEIIEALSGSGNTGGTGNHTEVWAGVLLRTELSDDAIRQFYGDNIQKVDAKKKETFAMVLLDKEFSSLNSVSKYDGYYIVERIDTAVSSFFDIRGH